MKKKIIFFTVLCTAIISLTACYPTGQIKETTETNTDGVVESNKTEESTQIENADVDTSNIVVYETDKKTVKTYSAEFMDFTVQDDLSYFDSDSESYDLYKDDDFGYLSYTNANGDCFYVDQEGRLNFSRKCNHSYEYCASYGNLLYTQNMTTDVFQNKCENQEILDAFLSYINDLGIDEVSNEDSMLIDSVTYNALNIPNQDASATDTITEEEEAYAVFANLSYDGVPVLKSEFQSGTTQSTGSYIDAIFDKENNLLSFNAFQIYDNLEETDEKTICDYDTALSSLITYYNSIEVECPITVRSCQLAYAAFEKDSKYILKPVWAFTYQFHNTEQGQDLLVTDIKLIDAYKGEVIL